MSGEAEFLLRCELHHHQEDVRAVCACGDDQLATASRDKTVALWQEQQGDPLGFTVTMTGTGHTHFATAVAWVPPGLVPGLESGGIASGSRDKRVLLFSPPSGAIVADLAGHEQQVMDLTVAANGDLVSAGVDSVARVWRDSKCLHVLSGHEGSVLAVLALPTGAVLTGSSDKSIKHWEGGVCTATWTGHADSVRCLALHPEVGVVSGSHDFTLRLWTLTGDAISELVGHTALVYKVACSAAGLIASASEDNTVRVWRGDGTCLQTLEHPTCAWAVAFLPSGDLVSGCGDAVARVWSQAPERQAGQDVQAAYRASIESRKSASASASQGGGGGGMSGVKMEDPSVLQYPGTSDGQVKVINEAGGGMAYSWSAAAGEWEKIGVVVPPPGTMDTGPGGKTYQGVTYDFVFDVEVDVGPPRKLPYNRDQNPYDVAQRWLEEQGLPGDQLEQVVNFLVQNSGGAAMPVSAMNVDPFTGGGAYVPAPAGAGGRPGFPSLGGAQVTGGGADPFTGGASAPASGSNARQLMYVPHGAGMLTFESAQYDGIAKKLCEFDATLSPEQGAVGQGTISDLMSRLKACAIGDAKMSEGDVATMSTLLTWPADSLFPVLDLVRLLVLTETVANQLGAAPISGALLSAVKRAATASSAVLATNQLVGLRLLCNCCKHPSLQLWMLSVRAEVLDSYTSVAQSTNKNARLALSSLLVNYAVLASNAKDSEGKLQVLSASVELLQDDAGDAEVLFRTFVAVGTVMFNDKEIIALAKDMGILQKAVTFSSNTTVKLAESAKDVTMVLERT